MEPIRDPARRKADVLHRLETDVDAWVASGDQHGGPPYLIPLSFLWDSDTLILATSQTSVTGRNLMTTGRVRIAAGHTRDVVLIDGMADWLVLDALPAAVADRFAAKCGFDPRAIPDVDYVYLRVRPERIQAWREVNEYPDRTVMRDGRWVV